MQRGPVRATRLLLVVSLLFVAMTLVGCAESLAFQSETGIVPNEATAGRQKLVTVYYVTREGNYLVPVNTEVPEGDDVFRHVVERLLAGPQDKELLSSPFPPGVLLKYVYVKDDRACVDLGGDAIKNMGPAAWQQALDSLAFTLTELPDTKIKSVEVLVNGVLDNNTLLERPEYINLIPGGPDDGPAARVYFSYNDIYLVPVPCS